MIVCNSCSNTLDIIGIMEVCPICREKRGFTVLSEGTFNTCSWCYRKYLVKSNSNNTLCSRCVKYISLELMEQVKRYTTSKKELEIYTLEDDYYCKEELG